MPSKILIKNAQIVTMNPSFDFFKGDILVSENRIEQVSKNIPAQGYDVFDAEGYVVTPGLIQTHIHLCQTLFRNLADDLSLLDWLKEKIWPFEAAHQPETLRLSAQLGLSELLKSGTTTILDMGTVQHQDVIFEELVKSGIRAFAGKTMMDYGKIPDGLNEDTHNSIDESVRLLKKWDGSGNGRIRYAFAPRFAVSCSDELLIETGRLAKEHNTLFHTHASENPDELDMVKKRFGLRNVEVFDKLGFARENLCLAHCIWLDENEKQLLKAQEIKVLHCPSSNLKLGSGIAAIPDFLKRGIKVSIGADGAPCNNNLDVFMEMRLAALIQKPTNGPQAMPAQDVFKLATINGAETLGLKDQIGSIEIGKKADLTFIKLNQVHSIPFDNIYSKLVYSTQANDVEHVMIDGQWIVRDKKVKTIDENHIFTNIENAVKICTN
ncbi:MAG: 5'-deoxyadenosine deaminase [Calditrichaeota bacterium]|nr:MAG: 5'-deoxyadenosine deaminase [Calditrichota bacterium]MBL1206759.1 5'-deoxyadenosine deaminase [Calditrichota bacterium]NOG46585.1 5'-deoxyadenosine deaminase [Calditrichota bacterium]